MHELALRREHAEKQDGEERALHPRREQQAEGQRQPHLAPQQRVVDALDALRDERLLVREGGRMQHGEGRERDEHAHLAIGGQPPVAQDLRHAQLVRRLRRRGEPARPRVAAEVVKVEEKEIENVHGTELRLPADVEGIDEGIARRAGKQRALHLRRADRGDDEEADDKVEDRGDQTLEAIGDHDADLPAAEREVERRRHEHEHDDDERRHFQRAEAQRDRQPAIVDEESADDRGRDAEIEAPGKDIKEAGEDADALAVTRLEELVEGERARLAKAVGDEAEDAEEKEEQLGKPLPERDGKSRVREDLHRDEQRHDVGAARVHRRADEEAARAAAGRKEVGHAAHVVLQGVREPEDQHQRHEDDHVVEQRKIHQARGRRAARLLCARLRRLAERAHGEISARTPGRAYGCAADPSRNSGRLVPMSCSQP